MKRWLGAILGPFLCIKLIQSRRRPLFFYHWHLFFCFAIYRDVFRNEMLNKMFWSIAGTALHAYLPTLFIITLRRTQAAKWWHETWQIFVQWQTNTTGNIVCKIIKRRLGAGKIYYLIFITIWHCFIYTEIFNFSCFSATFTSRSPPPFLTSPFSLWITSFDGALAAYSYYYER